MRIYDFVMTHKLDADDFFIHRVQSACAEKGLNFFLIEPLWVESFFEKLQKGRIWARVMLNMHSEHHLPEDVYHQLVKLAFERKTHVIDPPEVALAAFNKARLHTRLLGAGFELPFTIIVPRERANGLVLGAEDRARLGTPFVIKPSMGYGKRGVLLDAQSEGDMARSMAAWPDPEYLFQRRIVPKLIDGAPAYFRVFYVFGTIWFCWWNCYTDRYSVLTPEAIEKHQLHPLREIVTRVADLSRMNFFSSEIALTADDKFILIDYVNDQCHMLTQSANPQMGVPDQIVGAIASRLVEAAAPWCRSKVQG